MNGTEAVDIGDLARFHSKHGVLPTSGPGRSAAEISSSINGVPGRTALSEETDWQGTARAEAPANSNSIQFDFEVPAEGSNVQPVSAPLNTHPVQEVEDNPFERYRPTRPRESTSLQTPTPQRTATAETDAPLWGTPVRTASQTNTGN
jgi:hypothetical protein